MGIVTVRKFPEAAVDEIGEEEAALGADATSCRKPERKVIKLEAKKGKTEANIDAKMVDMMWKFNLLMFAFAVVFCGVHVPFSRAEVDVD